MDDLAAPLRLAGAPSRDVLALAPAPESRTPPDGRQGVERTTEPGAVDTSRRRLNPLLRFGRGALRLVATALVLAGAAVAALIIWDAYVVAPWTRDGRVRVQVASVAPQVSGQITEVRVVDDQYVHKGDVIYIIDRFDYQNALDQARMQVKLSAADYQVKSVQAERVQRLTNLATTPEQQQQTVGTATQAEATFKSAQVKAAMAEVNLARTAVRSPVNGFITNLQMRVGDYATAGKTNISVIDADSYWVDGYFEETKMAHVCVGDPAQAQLMGYREPIVGVVQSVTRGIAVSDAASGTQGLPGVDAVYTWVRLAQRVPVRIRITSVPPGVPLVSGMTATVSVRAPALEAQGPWWRQRVDNLKDRLTALYAEPMAKSGCVPALGSGQGRTVTLPTAESSAAPSAGEINPGLAPGLTQSPRMR